MKVQRCPLESTDKRKIVKVDIISQQTLSDEDENYFGHILPIKTGHLIATWCIVVGRFRRNQISLSSRKYLTRNAYVLWTHSFWIFYFLVKVKWDMQSSRRKILLILSSAIDHNILGTCCVSSGCVMWDICLESWVLIGQRGVTWL